MFLNIHGCLDILFEYVVFVQLQKVTLEVLRAVIVVGIFT
jgi:hypothetical protein